MKFLILLFALCPSFSRYASFSSPELHDRAYWRASVEVGFALPNGADPETLLLELNALFESPDPELRDEFGYGIFTSWIFRQDFFNDEQLQAQVQRLCERLKGGARATRRRAYPWPFLQCIESVHSCGPRYKTAFFK